MRLGGDFPFSTSDASIGSGEIVLGPGAVFYPPAGNYLIDLGAVTVLQVFDPVTQFWHSVGQGYVQNQGLDTDGTNWRLINFSGICAAAAITAAGSGA